MFMLNKISESESESEYCYEIFHNTSLHNYKVVLSKYFSICANKEIIIIISLIIRDYDHNFLLKYD